ncbi:MAG TPA: HAMP domain-containing sensor histidine kinase, partial [Bacillota bacterium]|nr:HAMP domain-containing sensor histidine kinase [Bacillota bacterium]
YESIGNALKVDFDNIKGEITGIEERITLILSIIETLQEYIGGNYNNLYQENVDLKKIIEGALKIQESSIRKNEIDIIKEFGEIQSVPIQSTKLTHILVNLIKNAIEAMEPTPVETRVLTISLFDNAKGNPVIRIADTGVGIESANLRKVFSFGYTTKEHGHGFGLHTCANQIKEMGGSITVHSDGPGKGATFTLTLAKN